MVPELTAQGLRKEGRSQIRSYGKQWQHSTNCGSISEHRALTLALSCVSFLTNIWIYNFTWVIWLQRLNGIVTGFGLYLGNRMDIEEIKEDKGWGNKVR